MEEKQNKSAAFDGFIAKYVQLELYRPEPSASLDIRSHIFGKSIPTGDPLADLDDRYYEHSVLRHSPYFKRVRNMRKNAELYFKEGIFPERYNPEHPLHPQPIETYQRSALEIRDDCKIITFETGTRLCIYKDGYISLYSITVTPPVICAKLDGCMEDVDDTYAEFLLQKQQTDGPDKYFVKLSDFYDGIDASGGNVGFIAEISLGGIVTSRLKIDINLQKITDINREMSET